MIPIPWITVGQPTRFRRSGCGFDTIYNPFCSVCFHIHVLRVFRSCHIACHHCGFALPGAHLDKGHYSGSGPLGTDRRKEGKGTRSPG